jgi:hypothetical protein
MSFPRLKMCTYIIPDVETWKGRQDLVCTVSVCEYYYIFLFFSLTIICPSFVNRGTEPFLQNYILQPGVIYSDNILLLCCWPYQYGECGISVYIASHKNQTIVYSLLFIIWHCSAARPSITCTKRPQETVSQNLNKIYSAMPGI